MEDEPQMWLEKVAAARAVQTIALFQILVTWPQKIIFLQLDGSSNSNASFAAKESILSLKIRGQGALEMLPAVTQSINY